MFTADAQLAKWTALSANRRDIRVEINVRCLFRSMMINIKVNSSGVEWTVPTHNTCMYRQGLCSHVVLDRNPQRMTRQKWNIKCFCLLSRYGAMIGRLSIAQRATPLNKSLLCIDWHPEFHQPEDICWICMTALIIEAVWLVSFVFINVGTSAKTRTILAITKKRIDQLF